jgi:hypothetical protein
MVDNVIETIIISRKGWKDHEERGLRQHRIINLQNEEEGKE